MSKVVETVLTLRDNVSASLNNASRAMNRYQNRVNRTGRRIVRTGYAFNNLGKQIMAVNAPLIGLGAVALKTGMEFDRSLSTIKAVSGATTKDMELLRAKALEVGSTTSKSATDAGNGMIYLAQAGVEVNDILKMTEPLTKASIAGQMDMARTSELLIGSMKSANIPLSENQKYLDQIAKTANTSKTEIGGLMESWIECGGSLRSANMTMEQTNALLGILGNANITGAEAGTSISRIFMNLNSTGGEANKVMKDQLKINTQVNGKMRNKIEVLKELKQKTDKLTEAERTQAIQAIGGKQYADDLKIILDGLGSEYDELTGKIGDSNGALNTMTKIISDDLKGDLDTFNSQLESVQIKVAEDLKPMAREMLKLATDLLGKIKEAKPETVQMVAKIVLWSTAFGLFNLVVGRTLITFGNLIINTNRVIRTIRGFGGVSGIFTALSSSVGKVGRAFKSMGRGSVKAFKLIGKGGRGALKGGKVVGNGFIKLFKTVGTTFGKIIVKTFDIAFKMIGKVGTTLVKVGTKLGPMMKKLGGGIIKHGGKAFKLISKGVTKILPLLRGVFGKVGKLLLRGGMMASRFIAMGAKTAMSAFVAIGPVGWAIVAVVLAISLAVWYLYKNWDKVKVQMGKLKTKFKEFGKVISGWKDDIVDKFKAIGTKWGELKEKLGNKIKAKVSVAKKNFMTSCKLIADTYNKVKVLLAQAIINYVKAKAKDYMDKIKKVQKAYKKVKTLFSVPLKATVKLLKNAFDEGIKKVKEKWEGLKEFLRHPIKGTINLFRRDSNVDGEHRSGRGRIPFDGYNAMLHKDEMVLTKSQADAYRQGGGTGGGNKVVNINVKLADTVHVKEEADAERLAKKLADEIKKAV